MATPAPDRQAEAAKRAHGFATAPEPAAASSATSPPASQRSQMASRHSHALKNEHPQHTMPCAGHKPPACAEWTVQYPAHTDQASITPSCGFQQSQSLDQLKQTLFYRNGERGVFLKPDSFHIVYFIKGLTSSPSARDV